MRNAISALAACALLVGCSTAGGIYKSGDTEHGEFSVGRTILTVIGVAAGVAAARNSGGGGGFADGGYAWDYQPGSAQWVCRDRSNGQYAYQNNCAGLAKFDSWP